MVSYSHTDADIDQTIGAISEALWVYRKALDEGVDKVPDRPTHQAGLPPFQLRLTDMFGNTYQNRRVLVTGHTGFKGSWLSLWLAKLQATVTGIALDPDTTPSHWNLLQLPASRPPARRPRPRRRQPSLSR